MAVLRTFTRACSRSWRNRRWPSRSDTRKNILTGCGFVPRLTAYKWRTTNEAPAVGAVSAVTAATRGGPGVCRGPALSGACVAAADRNRQQDRGARIFLVRLSTLLFAGAVAGEVAQDHAEKCAVRTYPRYRPALACACTRLLRLRTAWRIEQDPRCIFSCPA